MSLRLVRAVLGSAGFRLRMYWRGALAALLAAVTPGLLRLIHPPAAILR